MIKVVISLLLFDKYIKISTIFFTKIIIWVHYWYFEMCDYNPYNRLYPQVDLLCSITTTYAIYSKHLPGFTFILCASHHYGYLMEIAHNFHIIGLADMPKVFLNSRGPGVN